MTSRKLMMEHAVAASAVPKEPDPFSPFASDRLQSEACPPGDDEEDYVDSGPATKRVRKQQPRGMKAATAMKAAAATANKGNKDSYDKGPQVLCTMEHGRLRQGQLPERRLPRV